VKKPLLIKRKSFVAFLIACALSLAVSGCATKLANRGNHIEATTLAEIAPGKQSREEVAELLGSPSSVTTFGDDTWYYISNRTETFAFFKPEVLERQVVKIKFGADGKVSKIDTLALDDGKNVDLVARTTPTHGTEMTVLEQVVGNLGRFKKKNQQRKEKSEDSPNDQPGRW
jgi:outer membrane protein assembly factor BamE (lipoprotein component of BamABCDE complex)